MNYYLPRFVPAIEDSRVTLSRALGLQTPVALAPVIGPRFDMPLGDPLPVDGRTFKSNDVVQGQHLVDGTWVGLEHRIEQGPCENATLRGLLVERCTKWASRAYRMGPGNRIVACAFASVYPEHAVYWNLRGGSPELAGLLVRNSLFLDIASQALQLVYRAREQGFDFEAAGDGAPGGPISVVDCLVRNAGTAVGDGNARAAFALSFFTTPHASVRVNRTLVDKSMQAQSTGCLLVQAFPLAWVGSSAFLAGECVQPIAKFEGTGQVTLQGSAFFASGGQRWISFENVGGAVIRGCRGNVRVHWNGRDVGAISDTLTLGRVE